ncbi:hypothetical protein [Bartonella sp. CM120XJJH]|uniref:hypothetical protein n=1 Tax=Bartonella sp. CM120XJJH TaxID=3243544 RepID=UPI0035D0CF3C
MYFDSDNGNRAVLIEFKSPTADYKNSGVSQLMYYAQTLQKAGVTEMYLYLIAEVDDPYEKVLLITNNFTKVFSPEGKYYRCYWSEFNACVQVMSLRTILSNAKLRNSTFMDIIKKDLLYHRSKQASQVFCSSIL